MSAGVSRAAHPAILCLDECFFSSTRNAMLEDAGYTVLPAASGKEALDLLKDTHVDLILSDQFFLGEAGMALAKKIKALRPEIPILLVSGELVSDDECRSVDAVISKRDGPTNLLVTIANALKL